MRQDREIAALLLCAAADGEFGLMGVIEDLGFNFSDPIVSLACRAFGDTYGINEYNERCLAAAERLYTDLPV